MSKEPHKHAADPPGSSLEVINTQKLTRAELAETIGLKPGRLSNLKDVKRLCSRLIRSFIRGEVSGNDAKTLSYLLSTYVTIAQGSDIEERLDELETKVNSEPE